MDIPESLLNLAILTGGLISGILLGFKTKMSKGPKSDPKPKLESSNNKPTDNKISLSPPSDKKMIHCADHNSVIKSNQDVIDLINKNHKEVKSSLKDINTTLLKNAREAGSLDARVTNVERDVDWLKDR